MSLRGHLAPLVAIAAFLLAGAPARASFLPVTTTIDESDGSCGDGDCSLRDALAVHVSGDTIVIPASVTPYQVTLGELVIASDVILSGAGAATTVIQANGSNRVFHAQPGVIAAFQDVTVTGGGVDTGAGIFADGATLFVIRSVVRDNTGTGTARGGGIEVADGALTITDSTVSGNSAFNGGGLAIDVSSFTMERSTVSGNTAAGNSGGGMVFSNDSGTGSFTGTIRNSTISGNHADTQVAGGIGMFIEQGGGLSLTVEYSTVAFNSASLGANVYVDQGTATFNSSIVSDAVTSTNCFLAPQGGAILSSGYNIDDDGTCGFAAGGDLQAGPGLGALADNGGPTLTHAISSSSPAFDSADPATCSTTATDQRGITRPQSSACDRGAFELAAAPPAPVTAVPAISPLGVGVLVLLLALGGVWRARRPTRRAS
jgi:CSLREA domain-containing protein